MITKYLPKYRRRCGDILNIIKRETMDIREHMQNSKIYLNPENLTSKLIIQYIYLY